MMTVVLLGDRLVFQRKTVVLLSQQKPVNYYLILRQKSQRSEVELLSEVKSLSVDVTLRVLFNRYRRCRMTLSVG